MGSGGARDWHGAPSREVTPRGGAEGPTRAAGRKRVRDSDIGPAGDGACAAPAHCGQALEAAAGGRRLTSASPPACR